MSLQPSHKCSPSLEKKTGGWKILTFAFKKQQVLPAETWPNLPRPKKERKVVFQLQPSSAKVAVRSFREKVISNKSPKKLAKISSPNTRSMSSPEKYPKQPGFFSLLKWFPPNLLWLLGEQIDKSMFPAHLFWWLQWRRATHMRQHPWEVHTGRGVKKHPWGHWS